jgi:hypothetical protein
VPNERTDQRFPWRHQGIAGVGPELDVARERVGEQHRPVGVDDRQEDLDDRRVTQRDALRPRGMGPASDVPARHPGRPGQGREDPFPIGDRYRQHGALVAAVRHPEVTHLGGVQHPADLGQVVLPGLHRGGGTGDRGGERLALVAYPYPRLALDGGRPRRPPG